MSSPSKNDVALIDDAECVAEQLSGLFVATASFQVPRSFSSLEPPMARFWSDS
jgi:hypothetical protein